MTALLPRPFSYTPVRLGPLDRITIGGMHYKLFDERDGVVILRSEEDDPRQVKYTELEFYQLHSAGGAPVARRFHAKHKLPYIPNPDFTFMSYPAHKRAKARFWKELFDLYDRVDAKERLPRSVDHLGLRMDELCVAALQLTEKALSGETVRGVKPPTVGHFNKMYRRYKDSGKKIEVLISRDEGPKRVHVVDQEALVVWEKWAEEFAHWSRPKFRDIYLDLKSDLHKKNSERKIEGKHELPTPSPKVFRRIIKGLGAYFVYCRRYSKEAADRKFGFSKGGYGFFRPGERVDIDEKYVDLILLLQYAHIWGTLSDDEKKLVPRIRVWVVVAIDLATRYILGMRFCTAPNAQATIDVIQMMMQDKRELSEYVGSLSPWIGRCRPERIVTDNGSGLVNDQVADILVECEIDHSRPEAGHPQARGHIESSFRTHRRVVRHFQGRTFKDIQEKGRYDPVKTASLPIDEFERNYVRAILDIYHNTAHEGLGGETPHNAWIRQTEIYKTEPLIEQDVMRHIFGMEFTRTADGAGITFLGVSYHGDKLAQWLLKDGYETATLPNVLIKVDLMEMASISFRHPDGLWYILDNTIDLLPGISVAEWLEVWRRVTDDFKETTDINMANAYSALIDLRESGEAAALRNPLGLRQLQRDEIDKAERALLHRAGFLRKRVAPPPDIEKPKVRKGAFIGERALGFDAIVDELTPEMTKRRMAATALDKTERPSLIKVTNPSSDDNTGSLIGGSDDLSF